MSAIWQKVRIGKIGLGILALASLFCVQAGSQPAPLIDGGLFFFPPTQSLLTVGGWGPPEWDPQQGVWSLSGSGWSAMPDIPEGVAHTSAAYDETRQRLIAMGGVFADTSTWSFDGTVWEKIAGPLTTEQGYDPEIVYDADAKQTVLYFATMSWNPGQASSSSTYILGANGWEKQTVSPAPGGYLDVGFVYDSARKESVLFTGQETWVWKSNAWTQKQPAANPSFDFGQFGMAYDAARQVVVVFGRGETWTWNGSNWTKLSPAKSPDTPERGFFAFGYDSKRQVVVLYGGEITLNPDTFEMGYLNDIWEWNGTTWSLFGGTGIRAWDIQ